MPRIVIIALMVALLALAFHPAFAKNPQHPEIDLEGGEVVAQAVCEFEHKDYACIGVKKDEKMYLVLLDAKGEFAIVLVTEREPQFLWRRDWTRI